MRIYSSVIIQSGFFVLFCSSSILVLCFFSYDQHLNIISVLTTSHHCFLPQPVLPPLLSPLSRPLLFPWQYLFMAALAWFQFRIPMTNFSQWINVCTLKVHVDILAAHFYSVFTLASYNSQIITCTINSFS